MWLTTALCLLGARRALGGSPERKKMMNERKYIEFKIQIIEQLYIVARSIS
jgi:hypothetical protein